MIPAAQLAGMRATVVSSLDTPVTIQRLTGLTYLTVGPATTCLVLPGRGTVSYAGLPSILALTAWSVTLPWNADVRVGDQLVTPFATYQVQRMEQPASYNVDTTVHCYQLFDASGAQVYMPVNATVAVKRGVYNAGTKQTSAPAVVAGLEAVPVYITDMGTTLVLHPGPQAAEFDLQMMWDPRYDIRDGDRIVGYNPSGSVNPALLQVQHAASPGDVPRRICLLKSLEPGGYSL